MTPAPELTAWGERLRERTQELAPDDAAYGYAHAHLAQALAKALERVGEIYDPDDGPPGSPLVDVDRCPDWALPWLAQLVGVTLPPDTAPADARHMIRDVAGWRRGTPGAIRAAIEPLLSGDKTIYFRERDPDAADPPYALDIVTRTDEIPETDRPLVNLVEDPSFDGTFANRWGTYQPGGKTGTAVKASSPSARTGSNVCVLTADAAGSSYIGVVGGGPVSSRRFTVTPGVVISAAGYTRASTVARTAYMIFAWYDGAGALITSISGNTLAQQVNVWKRTRVLAATPPANAATAQVYCAVSSPAGNEQHLVDDILVLEGAYTDATMPDYFDPNAAGYRWLGTPNASRSERIPTTLVRDALLRQKPAGIVLTYGSVPGYDWQQVPVEHADWNDVKADYSTWQRVVLNEPG